MSSEIWVTIACYGPCGGDVMDDWEAFTSTGYGAGVELARAAIAAYVEEHGCPDCRSLDSRLEHFARYAADGDLGDPIERWDIDES